MTGIFNLTGKGAIVTGASRGIGKAIAEVLAAQGASVVISSRKQDACETVAAGINASQGGRAFPISANIGSKPALEQLIAASREALGQIDILVCNAASNPHYGSLSSIPDEAFEKILRNNVLANHWLAQLVAPDMVARHDGAIIFVGSTGGFRGSKVIGAYNVSKTAGFQLTRNLAVELGPSNVRVNSIAPGLTRTEFARALWEDEGNLDEALAGTPLSRLAEPEDIAGAVAFLASPAARYITGQIIVVDGGSLITGPGI